MDEYPVPVTEALVQQITKKIVEHFDPEKIVLFGSRSTVMRMQWTRQNECATWCEGNWDWAGEGAHALRDLYVRRGGNGFY